MYACVEVYVCVCAHCVCVCVYMSVLSCHVTLEHAHVTLQSTYRTLQATRDSLMPFLKSLPVCLLSPPIIDLSSVSLVLLFWECQWNEEWNLMEFACGFQSTPHSKDLFVLYVSTCLSFYRWVMFYVCFNGHVLKFAYSMSVNSWRLFPASGKLKTIIRNFSQQHQACFQVRLPTAPLHPGFLLGAVKLSAPSLLLWTVNVNTWSLCTKKVPKCMLARHPLSGGVFEEAYEMLVVLSGKTWLILTHSLSCKLKNLKVDSKAR